MTFNSMAVLGFENVGFLPLARVNLLPKLKFSLIFMKIYETLLLTMELKFRNFNSVYVLLPICLNPSRSN